MKRIIKGLVPQFILRWYSLAKYNNGLKKSYCYDRNRYAYSTFEKTNEEALIAVIVSNCHSIEKGFTMPEFRYGFGQERLSSLINLCKEYIESYGTSNSQIANVVKVFYEYRHCHKGHEEALDKNLVMKIDKILSSFPNVNSDSIQIDTSSDSYFAYKDSSFDLFSASRHSVRNFSDEPVSLEVLGKAIRLAQNSPSACNRQSTRLYVVEDKKKIMQVLSLQTGNRGFGHTVDKLIIVSGFLGGYSGEGERNFVYVDTGIFTMNLLYALHYNKIGACVLNWTSKIDLDLQLRKVVPIKENEIVSCMIVCGNIVDTFKVCESGKKDLSSMMNII